MEPSYARPSSPATAQPEKERKLLPDADLMISLCEKVQCVLARIPRSQGAEILSASERLTHSNHLYMADDAALRRDTRSAAVELIGTALHLCRASLQKSIGQKSDLM